MQTPGFPRRVSCVLCILISTAFCYAQTPVDFAGFTTVSGNTPANIYTADLNNDGITDIIQDSGQSPSGFTVSIGNGDGTFKAPVAYTLPVSNTIAMGIATADFNYDGTVDIAVSMVNTNQIAVFPGYGDGTFAQPIVSTIDLPSGYSFAMAGVAAADFNADNDVDLAVWAYQGIASTQLYVLQGQGNSHFDNTPNLVLAGPEIQPGFQLFAGDFDSDGQPDLVATTSLEASNGSVASSTIHVLYGHNNFTFDDTTPYTANDSFRIGCGDLNSDGYTDIFGQNSLQQLGVFYGNSSRTFDSYFYDIPNSSEVGSSPDGWQWAPQFVTADFNGDGSMDLAATAFSTDYKQSYIEFLLSAGGAGEFTPQVVALPNTYIWETTPVVGLFGGGMLTPDITLNQSPNGGSPPQNTPSYLVAELNQASSGWFGPCAYPRTGKGFNVCSAGAPSPDGALFSASVNSFGSIRKVELWVDGVKVSEQYHTWGQHAYFDWSGNFSNGTHQATFYAADVDNRLQRYDFSFTVGAEGANSCPAPSQSGINICSPGNYTTDSSPVQALASASIDGTLARMEIWVDGAKVYTETNSLTESETLNLAAGNHTIDFYAANTGGMLWENSSHVTVQ